MAAKKKSSSGRKVRQGCGKESGKRDAAKEKRNTEVGQGR
jgi:hypothetical protein